METIWFLLTLLALAAVLAGAHSLWAYLASGRYRATRARLRLVVVAALGDAGHARTFLFILERTGRAVEVRLPIDARELEKFRECLAIRVREEFPHVQISVLPLTESLAHLRGAVAVWGRPYGNVYVGRGGAEHAA